MRFLYTLLTVLVALAGSASAASPRAPAAVAAAPMPTAATRFPTASLQRDIDILERAYLQLHPGLYRYNTPAQVHANFKTLRRALNHDATLAEAYLAFSRFAATVHCGHTYANFYNQSKAVTAALLESPTRVPFQFRWVDGTMAVTRNLSADTSLVPGTRVQSIDGVPTRRILAAMLRIARADGSNDAKRVASLEVRGFDLYGTFERELLLPGVVRETRYRRIPADLQPYLDTWDRSFDDWGGNVTVLGDGFYRLQREGESPDGERVAPKLPRFAGRVYVLVGANNSSATFEFARAIRQSKLGTLVGQTTGGSLRGINGGAFYFLRLPNSGIELHLPLVGQFPTTPQPDAGIVPDIVVPVTVADIAAGRDAELAAAVADLDQAGSLTRRK